MSVTKWIYVYLQQTINNGYYCETYEVKPLCFILNLKQSDLCVNNLSYLKSPFWVLALFSRGFELLLDLISLNETKTAPRLQSHGTLFFSFFFILSAQQNMSYGWTKGSLMCLSVPVTYHVIEKWDSPSKYMICPIGLRPSLHRIHQISHLSLFQMLIIP